MIKRNITLMVMLLICSASGAQTCDTDAIEASTPSNRFSGRGATVTDLQTTLSWMRCAAGQEWNGSHCRGQPKIVNWKQAMALVEKTNMQGFDGHNDWRMPMILELASIIELQCINPRVNTTVFPDTPSTIFWTGMEKMSKPDYAYTLDFGIGEATATLKSETGAIRLVRGAAWWKPSIVTMH